MIIVTSLSMEIANTNTLLIPYDLYFTPTDIPVITKGTPMMVGKRNQ